MFQPAWAQTTLKISHQFPGGTLTEGDFRDRMTRMFAAEVEKRSKGSLKFAIYPGSSLMKTNAQFSAMRKGALDLSLVPLSYAGGEVPEVNIGLFPDVGGSYFLSRAPGALGYYLGVTGVTINAADALYAGLAD